MESEDPEYDDHVRATRLVPYTLVPGLARFDGYTGLTSRLTEKFEVIVGDPHNPQGPPANYFEFPYDWRKDNGLAARLLKKLIDRELQKWRIHSDNPDAKVILIAHSMGGLVSRYYIEALQGFEKTRALITFGTPHRGSVEIINYLANGYRKLGMQLDGFTAAMRSFPSVYQMLPRYEAVLDTDGVWKRIFETTTDLPDISRQRAKAAYEFYDKIDREYAKNETSDEYSVELLPVFGWGHETLQSAVVTPSGKLECHVELPPVVEAVFANGDGAVPRVSAIPVELNQKPLRWWPVNQRHATMQNNEDLVNNLVQVLAALQGQLQTPARELGARATDRGIALEVDAAYLVGEPVSMRVTVNTGADPEGIFARIEHAAGSTAQEIVLTPDGAAWIGEATGLAPGDYRVTVRLGNQALGPRDPVADIFAVV